LSDVDPILKTHITICAEYSESLGGAEVRGRDGRRSRTGHEKSEDHDERHESLQHHELAGVPDIAHYGSPFMAACNGGSDCADVQAAKVEAECVSEDYGR